MVLGKLPVPGRPTNLDKSRARTFCACSRCRWRLFGHFFSRLYFSFPSPSLWETARYRLKYYLKGPLNPKQPTNQPLQRNITIKYGGWFVPFRLSVFFRRKNAMRNDEMTQSSHHSMAASVCLCHFAAKRRHEKKKNAMRKDEIPKWHNPATIVYTKRNNAPPHQDLHRLQFQLFASLVLKEKRKRRPSGFTR